MQNPVTELLVEDNLERTFSVPILASHVDTLLLLLVGVAGVADGLRVILTKMDTVGSSSAGGWIVLLGGLLIAVTCVHAVKEVRSGQNAGAVAADDEVRQPVVALAMLLVYIALINPLGYTLSTALFMAIYLRVFGKYGVLKVATISIAFALASSWLWSIMDMMLPQGILPWP